MEWEAATGENMGGAADQIRPQVCANQKLKAVGVRHEKYTW